MKIIVYGAGVIGTVLAARLHEARHDVTLVARGGRLAALQQHGIMLAEGDNGAVRSVAVPVVEHPAGHFDLIVVAVRTHQVDSVLESIARLEAEGEVLFLLNWAAGSEAPGTAIGRERVLLGFPTIGGVMDGDVVRYRSESALTRLVTMPIGEVDGTVTGRVRRTVQVFRSAGVTAKPEAHMLAWLATHAAFEVPLGLAVHAAGGPTSLASNPGAIREMLVRMRANLGALPGKPVPRAFGALRIVPIPILVTVLRLFLRSDAAGPLRTDSPAVQGELEFLDAQLQAERARS
ncbi:ketopantoate reductase [Frondihabitans sp. PAMC 28766]|uniref:ketopantoate reductase family protein n=1 Tax=Frondihabitans sp. PAMC 28766 TaxID=1795630 RepID=UPI00078EE57C|nr:2-dehydropantoate 2-reductase N-terminal domain-containing protein [Frondihabitans sp. PAMC 28766]AMM20621.1 ketopantoate reductase [Frondihabitans sp. PAMC 28766]